MESTSSNRKILVSEIIPLIRRFSKKQITGKQFNKEYEKIRNRLIDNHIVFGNGIDDLLDDFYSELDAFEPDPVLLRELNKEDREFVNYYIDEEEFRKIAKNFLIKIKKPKNPKGWGSFIFRPMPIRKLK